MKDILTTALLVIMTLAMCVWYWRGRSKIDKIGSASVFAISFAALLLDVLRYWK